MKSKFYKFSSKLSGNSYQAHAKGLRRDADVNGLHDQHKLILGIYDDISFPVVFEHKYGKKIEDVIDTGWPGLYLVSGKTIDVMKSNHLTGWQLFRCKLLDQEGNEINGYYGLSILGRSGEINYGNAEIIDKHYVPDGPITKLYKGLPIGLDTWDGTDFFLPAGYFGPIISLKAMEAFKKLKISNVRCIALSEIETPEFGLPAKWKK